MLLYISFVSLGIKRFRMNYNFYTYLWYRIGIHIPMRVKISAYPTLRLTSILIRRSGSSGRFLLSYYRFHNPTIIAYY